MTKWIERYRHEAEERYQRLDAVLAEMNERRNKRPPSQERPHDDHDDQRRIKDGTTAVEAPADLPVIRLTREFAATPGPAVPGAHRRRAVRPVDGPGPHAR